jgi:polyhydroxyalkanoate synthase
MANPAWLMQAQLGFWQDYLTLWQNTARRMMGEQVSPVISEDSRDRRFKDEAWRENEVFDFIRQSYLLSARFFQNVAANVDGMDEKTAQKVDFYTRPEVLRKTAETGGENLLKGLSHLLNDLERGKGRLRIRMTDDAKFRVGENIAVSPGKVVYQNDLMQLIQYGPATDTVLKRPLVIFPPWINKFYILDLRPKNSFDRWAVEKATGEEGVNAIGYCLGGTLLATTLAHMAAKGDDRIKTATYFVTLTDFSEVGELGVFIDEEQLRALEAKMQKRGYLEGREMATTFNMLRANDLIWSLVVNN